MTQHHLHLVPSHQPPEPQPTALHVAELFDPTRLRQVMAEFEFSIEDLAYQLGVLPFFVHELLTGIRKPHPDHVESLARMFSYPIQFFAAGRPQAHLDSSQVHVCEKCPR